MKRIFQLQADDTKLYQIIMENTNMWFAFSQIVLEPGAANLAVGKAISRIHRSGPRDPPRGEQFG
jgi:hypothetical protein